jgi:Tfp pilus assembly major pilin PilA
MNIDSLLSMITPAVVGSILIAIIKIIYDRYKTIEKEKQVTSASDRLNTTRQIEMILSANESLRKELRIDVERLRKEMDTMSQASKTEMEELKLSYEKEIEVLQLQITKMNSELVLYREEHRQMRQLLSKEGIVFNSAISTKKGA